MGNCAAPSRTSTSTQRWRRSLQLARAHNGAFQKMAAPANSQTILAVDDTPTNIALLAGLLGEQYRVKAATSGAKALELAAASPPDLILLDIMMPGLSGYDVLERLQGDLNLREIPVIMISAVDEIESVIRCIELGAEDY